MKIVYTFLAVIFWTTICFALEEDGAPPIPLDESHYILMATGLAVAAYQFFKKKGKEISDEQL